MQAEYPMDIIGSKNWYWTFPTNRWEQPDTVEVGAKPDLMTYSDEYFHLSDDKTGVVMFCPTDGQTTKNSRNPRTEGRQMENDGKTKSAWSSTVGRNTIETELMITAVPIGSRPNIVIQQVHDSEDDVTVWRFEGNTSGDRTVGSLWITDGNTSHGFLVTNALDLNTVFRVGIQSDGGKFTYTFNGEIVNYSQKKSVKGCYFKTGCYVQSGGTTTKLPDGKPDYGEVVLYAVQVCRDGVCAGNAPGSTGSPTDPVDPIDPPIDPALAARVTALESGAIEQKADTSALRAGLGALGSKSAS